jgi:hypothetical protein
MNLSHYTRGVWKQLSAMDSGPLDILILVTVFFF